MASALADCATDRKSTSTLGRCRVTAGQAGDQLLSAALNQQVAIAAGDQGASARQLVAVLRLLNLATCPMGTSRAVSCAFRSSGTSTARAPTWSGRWR